MLSSLEHGQSPESLFSSTKLIVEKHLFSGALLPGKAIPQLRELLSQRTMMLSEDEYFAQVRKTAVSGVTEENESDFFDQVSESRAMFIPGMLRGVPDLIIVRERTVTDLIDKPYRLLGGLLEEVSHAYSSIVEPTPLVNVPEGSHKLSPFPSYDDLEGTYTAWRNNFLGLPGSAERDRLEIVTRGFNSVVREKEENGQITTYPKDVAQNAQEEARALIAHSLFAVKVHGSLKRPFGSLREQVTEGFQSILATKRVEEDFHESLPFGLYFLAEYLSDLKAQDSTQVLKTLSSKLFTSDIDEFLQFLEAQSPQSRLNFIGLINKF